MLISAPHEWGNHQTLTLVLEGTAANSVTPSSLIAGNRADLLWQNVNALSPIHPGYTGSSTTGTITVPAAFTVTKSSNTSSATIAGWQPIRSM